MLLESLTFDSPQCNLLCKFLHANSFILTTVLPGPKLSAMQWTEPRFEEISLGCEINSYACAEI